MLVAGLFVALGCDSTPVPPIVTDSPAPSSAASVDAASPGETGTPAPTGSASPVPTDLPTPAASPRVFTSDDGQMTIEAPGGALPDDVSLTATALGGRDLPPELFGLDVRSAFYLVAPSWFGIGVTGHVYAAGELSRSEAGPRFGRVAGSGAGDAVDRRAMGWLDAQALATDGETVTVSGQGGATGTLFAFGATTFVRTEWSEPTLDVPVGSSATLTVSLTFPTDTADRPLMSTLDVSIDATDVVTLGSTTAGPDGSRAARSSAV